MATPRVLQSLHNLGAISDSSLPITRLATTYTMAQDVSWVDLTRFAVGRWDGTLSVFDANATGTQGATITTAVTLPSDEGVQMVEWIAAKTFITSNDDQSILVWRADQTFQSIQILQTLKYDAAFGVANSGSVATVANGTNLFVVTGHANGMAVIWQGNMDGTNLTFNKSIDLTIQNPVNPWGLQNIRGVQAFHSDNRSIKFITGSENGEICVLDIPSGNVISRALFNHNAKRGINALSALGQKLLVANCSVGVKDKNLWYYWIDGETWSIHLRDAKNLIVDTTRPQVFNFDVVWGRSGGNFVFYSATEEGALWMGSTSDSSISTLGYEPVASADLGAALAGGIGSLAYVAYNVSSFDTDPTATLEANQNPNILTKI